MRQHLVPTGGLIPFAGSAATEGYLLCDGSGYEISKYAGLYAVIGFTYGGSVTTFKVPDLRGRVPVGAGTGTGGGVSGAGAPVGGVALTARTLGAYDGDERLHAHNHTASDSGHTHSAIATAGGGGGPTVANWTVGGASGGNAATFGTSGSSSAAITVANNSQGGLRQNVPPSVILNYLIKY